MKTQKINIPIFDYHLTIIEIENTDTANDVLAPMLDLKCTSEHIKHIQDHITSGRYDGGDCFRNMELKKMLIIILPCSSNAKKNGILAHELRHAVDRLCEHCCIEDIETPAYITGYIYEKLK